MAKTQDYLDYLNDRITIAPVNSQEELQAAQTIANLFDAHGLEPVIQEFDTPDTAVLFPGILLCALFLGTFLSGISVSIVSVIGILIVLAAAALLILRHLGNDVLGSYGPAARSQNVIAFHEATGDMVAHGNRPIIIAAHYDTPREDLFFRAPLAQYQALIKQICVPCVPALAVLAILQAFGFIPGIARRVIWLIALIVAVPVLVWGVAVVGRRFMGYTTGANDNKSGLAALLGILDAVRPASSDGVPRSKRSGRRVQKMVEEPSGVRRGAEVLKSLGVLPATCEIEYAEPKMVPVYEYEDEPQEWEDEAAAETGVIDEVPAEFDEGDVPDMVDELPLEADETNPMEPTPEFADEAAPLFEELPNMPAGEDPDATMPSVPTPEPAAPVNNVPRSRVPAMEFDDEPAPRDNAAAGRRASLFDLPDPSQAEVDPLASTSEREALSDRTVAVSRDDISRRADVPAAVRISDDRPRQQEIGVVSPEDLDFEQQRKRRGLFGRKRQQEDDGWKGGATVNGRFRVIEGTAPEDSEDVYEDAYAEGPVEGAPEQEFEPVENYDEAPAEFVDEFGAGEDPYIVDLDSPNADDLREAILSLGDDALICHDIWFVALGGSELNHAGMRAFLGEYRRACRGAFLFNLNCVGAGQLSVLTQEGLDNSRKADRRIIRLLRDTAASIHVDLAEETMTWGDTDATPAMRTSLRSATLVGLDEFGLPAYSRTMDDVPENLDGRQVESVVQLVLEAIRRS